MSEAMLKGVEDRGISSSLAGNGKRFGTVSHLDKVGLPMQHNYY